MRTGFSSIETELDQTLSVDSRPRLKPAKSVFKTNDRFGPECVIIESIALLAVNGIRKSPRLRATSVGHECAGVFPVSNR